jgi:hypothetical protein
VTRAAPASAQATKYRTSVLECLYVGIVGSGSEASRVRSFIDFVGRIRRRFENSLVQTRLTKRVKYYIYRTKFIYHRRLTGSGQENRERRDGTAVQ